MSAQYAETAVLVAVMNEDEDEALARLRDFLPGELRAFDEQLREVLFLIGYVRRNPKAES